MIMELANQRLQTAGIPTISDEDATLLYVVLLALYEEGVRPTLSEVHHKLKGMYELFGESSVSEHHCSWEVEQNFLAYYLSLCSVYEVLIDGVVQSHQLSSIRSILKTKISKSDNRSSETVILLKQTPGKNKIGESI